MKKTDINSCIYVNSTKENRIIIIIYVDDLLIASRDIKELTRIKKMLMSQFQMKDLGPASSILRINIERDGITNDIKLLQQRYIRELLEKFGMTDAKPVTTPLEANVKFSRKECPCTKAERDQMKYTPYKELIGGLVYLSNATRPDLAFPVSVLSRFAEIPV